jgi:hypothetical protein
MATISVQAKLTTEDLLRALEQLDLLELEKVARHITRLRTHKSHELDPREAELLKTARQRRPRAFQNRYQHLMQQRQKEALTSTEYEELLRMTGEAEAFETQRIKALMELAEIRRTDIDSLMGELGLLRHA